MLTRVPTPGFANDASDAAMDVTPSTNRQRPMWKPVPAKTDIAFCRLRKYAKQRERALNWQGKKGTSHV